ncbi:putative nuclease HARBI1 [Eurosta solidaginis]|uniref:putative nuclease HARBI1 n=1 Tax=Eurosta solidaginis TaxID=178769 RepID=UPI0035308596
MIVCDHSMTIRYINAKYPGAPHDSLVFNMSALNSHLEQLHQGLRNTWFLGDAGYVLKPCLLTPFRNPEDGSAESINNTQHAKELSNEEHDHDIPFEEAKPYATVISGTAFL